MKNKEHKLTVIIPCLNASKTIRKALQSLREQTYKNFECIVMDGNSTDGTQNIVNEYLDVVSVLISENDESGASAVNKALEMSNGELIGFLYADDYFLKNALYEINNAYNKKNCDFISYGLRVINLKNNKVIMNCNNQKNIQSSLENACFKHVLNHFYHKNVFNDIGKLKPLYFDNTIFYSNDREFLIRLCLYNKKNYCIPKILYIMCYHKDSYTGSRKNVIKIRYEHIGIADYYLLKPNLSKENKRILVEFKYHNLCILFFLYLITFNLYSASIIFYRGLLLRKIMWLPDLIYRPLKEIIYRISLKL